MRSRNEAEQVFDGVMLSDASIQPHGKAAQFFIALSGKEHIDWLKSVSSYLPLLGIEPCSGHPKVVPKVSSYGKPYEQCLLITRNSTFLLAQRKRWYPEGTKVIPRDVLVTPISIANAFMGDGNSAARVKQNAPHLILLTLSIEGFAKEDLMFFEEKLRTLGIQGHADTKGRNGYRVSNTKSVNTFMDMVEPYVVSSYRYKIKRSGHDYN